MSTSESLCIIIIILLLLLFVVGASTWPWRIIIRLRPRRRRQPSGWRYWPGQLALALTLPRAPASAGGHGGWPALRPARAAARVARCAALLLLLLFLIAVAYIIGWRLAKSGGVAAVWRRLLMTALCGGSVSYISLPFYYYLFKLHKPLTFFTCNASFLNITSFPADHITLKQKTYILCLYVFFDFCLFSIHLLIASIFLQ